MIERATPVVIRKRKVDGHRASRYGAWDILVDKQGNEWMNAACKLGVTCPREWYRYDDAGYNSVQVERQRSISKWLRERNAI